MEVLWIAIRLPPHSEARMKPEWRMVAEFACDKVLTLDSGHSPSISTPELLTAQLDEVTKDAASRPPSARLTE